MKRLLALLITLSLLLGCAAAEPVAETAAEPATTHQIEMKTFPFYVGSKTTIWWEDFPLYFVDGTEDLPFVELNDWGDLRAYCNAPDNDASDNGYRLTVRVDEAENKVIFIRKKKTTS